MRSFRRVVKRIFDPVHHFIELSTAEARLLDLPVMQRLRRLRQLGLAYLAFPSAEHSRFTHALGALAMGTRAFDELFRTRRSLLRRRCGRGVSAAARSRGIAAPRHRSRTLQSLLRERARRSTRGADERSDRAPRRRARHRRARSRRGRRAGVDRRRSAKPLSGPARTGQRPKSRRRPNGLPAARRVLHRRLTGRYDAEQLVASLRVFERDRRLVVGIDRRGIVALESFVMARYMMFASVYFHHTTRMFERSLARRAARAVAGSARARSHRRVSALGRLSRAQRARRCEKRSGARASRSHPDLCPGGRVQRRARLERVRSLSMRRCANGSAKSNVWADSQAQLLHRLPFGIGEETPPFGSMAPAVPSTHAKSRTSSPSSAARPIGASSSSAVTRSTLAKRGASAARSSWRTDVACPERSRRAQGATGLRERADCRLGRRETRDRARGRASTKRSRSPI